MSRQESNEKFWAKRQKSVDRKLSAFPVSHMSNTKWRKLFLALFEKKEEITGYRWNFVDGEVYTSGDLTRVLNPDDLLKSTTADKGCIPVAMPYREIISLVVVTENGNELMAYLDGIARFKIVACDDGFEVLGYE